MFLPIAKYFTKPLKNDKMVKLDTYQTYFLPPNLTHLGGWLVSLASYPMVCTGHADCQPPFFVCQVNVFFWSLMPGQFPFWCQAIWCRKNGPTDQNLLLKKHREVYFFI